MFGLKTNQVNAIESVKNNDFNSGVIAHATGTGKSVIGIHLIKSFIENNKNSNIFWLCEFKTIINELFSNDYFSRELNDIQQNYTIFNYAKDKPKNWVETINNCETPFILFINRAFLTSQEKYKVIHKNIDFIIHDECHSIKNKTTKEFYNHISSKNSNYKVIGLSATPLKIYPFENIIHSYTLYDALLNNDLVTPQIVWLTKEGKISSTDIMLEVKEMIKSLPFKKIIIWCGLIKECEELAKQWQKYFTDFKVCIDTSIDSEIEGIGTFDNFKSLTSNGFLFCAAKHREGSDIKNLDGCIFMDQVSKRTPKTFIQCLGRVLRLQENKSKGLIIDIKAKSAYDVIKRMAAYLNNDKEFPYDYSYYYSNDGKIKINNLIIKQQNYVCSEIMDSSLITKEFILKQFKKPIIDSIVYKERLENELDMFIEKNLLKYLYFAIEILNLTSDIPHVTRGSCGSSLLCYYLGISHVDPVKYNIKFERFLNIYRNNLPDIDFDFPHTSRDEIFFRLEKKWPGKIARISNHVHYHEKSAKRAALKELGHNKFIGKYEINDYIKKLPKATRDELNKRVKNLENKFRMYSLHCGGIVFYPEGVPDYLKHTAKSQNVINQITLNKYDISSEKRFKIDILSSRALTQICDIDRSLAFKDFTEIEIDADVMELFSTGKNIGITLSESPLIKKAMLEIKPKNITDLALILAIIRPAAKDVEKTNSISHTDLVYDDDAIDFIAKYCNVDLAKADYYRRNIVKYNKEVIDEVNKLLSKDLQKKLDGLHGYGFCKAHAYSYAELIYKLAYLKKHKPEDFWKSTLKNAESSYRNWVHYFEAKLENVDFKMIKEGKDSVYCKNRNKEIYKLNHEQHFAKYGIWNIKKDLFYPNCYGFIDKERYIYKGIIASIKVLGKMIIYFICVGIHKYIEVSVKKDYVTKDTFKKIGIKGFGKLQDSVIISVKSIRNQYF